LSPSQAIDGTEHGGILRTMMSETSHVGVSRQPLPFRRSASGRLDREVLANGRLQRTHAAMRAAFDLFLPQERESAFDEIEPQGARRREMELKCADVVQTSNARVGSCGCRSCPQSAAPRGRLAPGVDRPDESEEELLTAMSSMTFAMSLPVATLSAAKSDVVPWRR
jgi:hypothetical protein